MPLVGERLWLVVRVVARFAVERDRLTQEHGLVLTGIGFRGLITSAQSEGRAGALRLIGQFHLRCHAARRRIRQIGIQRNGARSQCGQPEQGDLLGRLTVEPLELAGDQTAGAGNGRAEGILGVAGVLYQQQGLGRAGDGIERHGRRVKDRRHPTGSRNRDLGGGRLPHGGIRPGSGHGGEAQLARQGGVDGGDADCDVQRGAGIEGHFLLREGGVQRDGAGQGEVIGFPRPAGVGDLQAQRGGRTGGIGREVHVHAQIDDLDRAGRLIGDGGRAGGGGGDGEGVIAGIGSGRRGEGEPHVAVVAESRQQGGAGFAERGGEVGRKSAGQVEGGGFIAQVDDPRDEGGGGAEAGGGDGRNQADIDRLTGQGDGRWRGSRCQCRCW